MGRYLRKCGTGEQARGVGISDTMPGIGEMRIAFGEERAAGPQA